MNLSTCLPNFATLPNIKVEDVVNEFMEQEISSHVYNSTESNQELSRASPIDLNATKIGIEENKLSLERVKYENTYVTEEHAEKVQKYGENKLHECFKLDRKTVDVTNIKNEPEDIFETEDYKLQTKREEDSNKESFVKWGHTQLHLKSPIQHSADQSLVKEEIMEVVTGKLTQGAFALNPTSTEKRSIDLENSGEPQLLLLKEAKLPLGKRQHSERKLAHNSVHTFECSICSRRLKSRKYLVRHALVHSNERPFECPFCSKRYKTKGAFVTHKRGHTNERPFACPTCNKRFKCKSVIERHLRVHTNERPFECSICSRAFKSKTECVTHSLVHTSERPFGCPTCSRRYKSRVGLVEHLRIHTKERPFECSFCSKRFKTKRVFLRHAEVHTNERPFQCPTCNNRFKSKPGLVSHLRVHSRRAPV